MSNISTYFICFLLTSVLVFPQKYVQIEEEVVNIRFQPTTSSSIVGQAILGQIFLRTDATNNWIEIELPSGENRWIYRSLVSLVTDYGAILQDVNIFSLKDALINAKERAQKDSFTQNIEFMNQQEEEMFLLDKYTLSVFRTFGVSPIHFQDIMNVSNKDSDIMFGNVFEKEVRVSFVDYDVFEVLGENIILETKRCFKIDKRVDAVIRISSINGEREESLCFIGGYGENFDDCYNIKNIFNQINNGQSNQFVLTKSGKLKEAKLILESTDLDLKDFKKITTF
tara:strand:+ start:92 stop:940 length:849 start_codon:yes stop_codon:yes gene_type:complete